MLRPLRRSNIRPRTRRDLKLVRIWDQNFQSIVWIFEHLVFRIFSMRRRFLRSMQRLLSSTVPSTRSVRFPSPEEPRLFQISERPTFSGFYTIFYPFSFFSYQLRRSTLLLFCLSLLTHIYIQHTRARGHTHIQHTSKGFDGCWSTRPGWSKSVANLACWKIPWRRWESRESNSKQHRWEEIRGGKTECECYDEPSGHIVDRNSHRSK